MLIWACSLCIIELPIEVPQKTWHLIAFEAALHLRERERVALLFVCRLMWAIPPFGLCVFVWVAKSCARRAAAAAAILSFGESTFVWP